MESIERATVAKNELNNTKILEDGSKMNVYFSNMEKLHFQNNNSGGIGEKPRKFPKFKIFNAKIFLLDYQYLKAKSRAMKKTETNYNYHSNGSGFMEIEEEGEIVNVRNEMRPCYSNNYQNQNGNAISLNCHSKLLQNNFFHSFLIETKSQPEQPFAKKLLSSDSLKEVISFIAGPKFFIFKSFIIIRPRSSPQSKTTPPSRIEMRWK